MQSRLPLALIAMILLTEAVAVVAFLEMRFAFHTNPFGFYVNFVGSAGGVAFGLIGGAGGYFGCKLAGVPRGSHAMAFTATATALALVLFHYASFRIVLARFGLDEASFGFGDYARTVFGHARMAMNSGSAPTQIGRGGYGLLASDFVWAMGFSLVPMTRIDRLPWCDASGCWHDLLEKRILRFFDSETCLAAVPWQPSQPFERALAMLRLDTGKPRPVSGSVQITLIHSQCPRCREQAINEKIEIFNGKHFIKKNHIEHRRAVPVRAAPIEPAPVPSNVAPRGGFGRKGLTS